jgi:hypothetical protein
MKSGFFSTRRTAGLMLLLGPALLLVAVAAIAAQGKLAGMAAGFQGVGPGSGDASGLRIIAPFAVAAQVVQLAGFAYLLVLLYEGGDRGPAVVALSLVVVYTVLALFEISFQSSVTVWAARQARAGATPEFFEPLRQWLNTDLQPTNMWVVLTAMVLFSWSAVRNRVLSSSIGAIALAWSLLAFPLYFLVLEAPVVYVMSPVILGVGLLSRG